MPPDYIWPLSKSTTPDEMNTSFGPRINRNKWDFHDGIDLPAPIGTNVYAVREGTVHRAGPGEPKKSQKGIHSRHVVLKVADPSGETMYVLQVHLHSIAERITAGSSVTQGQLLGSVGEDGATYPHLHIEFRKGSFAPENSVHPLGYLPYVNTANFTAPVLDRFNRLDTRLAARLVFDASSKLEGDLQRVEVDLMSGATLLKRRVVDFNDKETIHEGNADEKSYKKDIAVEGYQKSDMLKDRRNDLKYGIVVRKIPDDCDALIARVIDVGGNVATSTPIQVPNPTPTNENIGFEDGAMPPAGWTALTSTSGTGTMVSNDPTAAHSGSRGMLCVDESARQSKQRAAIEYSLPAGRFQWIAEGWFKPVGLKLSSGHASDLLLFRSGDANLSVAARIYKNGGALRAGLIVKNPDCTLSPKNSTTVIAKDRWRKWGLHLLRIGSRETTAVLYLDDDEKLRVNWDSTAYEPKKLRVGIGLSPAGSTATVLADELRLTESRLSP